MNARRPLIRMYTLMFALSACDADFDVSRDALGPARIAALGTQRDPGGRQIAAAAIWSGEGLYHDEAPTLSWSVDGAPLGEGWEVEVPASGELGLVVTLPDGDTLNARVDLVEPPPALTLSREAVDLSGDLGLEARRAVTGEVADDTVAAGQATRLSLSWSADPGAADYNSHWMLADGVGTVLPLDALVADVLAEAVVWDDGVVESREATDATLLPGLALTLDGTGANAWTWADAAIGETIPLLRHEGRLMPLTQADAETVRAEAMAAGAVLATLVARDDVLGVGLDEVAALPLVDGQPDLSQQDTLSCARGGEAFRVAWIAEGRCPLPEVLGARVVLEVW